MAQVQLQQRTARIKSEYESMESLTLPWIVVVEGLEPARFPTQAMAARHICWKGYLLVEDEADEVVQIETSLPEIPEIEQVQEVNEEVVQTQTSLPELEPAKNCEQSHPVNIFSSNVLLLTRKVAPRLKNPLLTVSQGVGLKLIKAISGLKVKALSPHSRKRCLRQSWR